MTAANINDMPPLEHSNTAETQKPKEPTVILVLGMAGSGKTTLMQRVYAHIQETTQKAPYAVNLDPAVLKVPYPTNIDIRDTVNYKEVMNQYHLGPNGGILTALNLFTTKFGQVLECIDRRAKDATSDYVIMDTPGQIEIFTWSASGSIISESLASSYPTVLVYVIDTPRATSPTTFMSNMLYACSILYKMKLPFIVVLNKNDVVDTDFATEWISDFEAFQNACQDTIQGGRGQELESTFMGSLVMSMALVLEEFYSHLRVVSCSALTGDGMDDFMSAVDDAVMEYET